MIEEWKDIPGYEGSYQVSSFGNVKSLNYHRTGKEKIMKPCFDTNGYLQLLLRKSNTVKSHKIHKLVAIAFHYHLPDGTMKLVVNHKDNNRLNNHKDNLEVVPHEYNVRCHKKDAGLSWCNVRNRWEVKIGINYKTVHLGRYKDEDKEKALQIYQRAFENVHLYDGDNSKFRELINS
jgi:hypothetical protein